MNTKDKIAIVIILIIIGGVVYKINQPQSVSSYLEQQLGPSPYISGPNENTEICRNLSREYSDISYRQADEEDNAEKISDAKLNEITRSQVPDIQRQIIINNLSAEDDIKKIARDNKYNKQDIITHAQLVTAGCVQINPNYR